MHFPEMPQGRGSNPSKALWLPSFPWWPLANHPRFRSSTFGFHNSVGFLVFLPLSSASHCWLFLPLSSLVTVGNFTDPFFFYTDPFFIFFSILFELPFFLTLYSHWVLHVSRSNCTLSCPLLSCIHLQGRGPTNLPSLHLNITEGEILFLSPFLCITLTFVSPLSPLTLTYLTYTVRKSC